MSALVISESGEVGNIVLKSRTLDEACEEYKTIFQDVRDAEMQDVHVRLGERDGTRECVCVIYDSASRYHKRNSFFEGKTRPVFGGILAFWTRVSLGDTATRDDVLLDRKLGEGGLMQCLKAFQDDMTRFVRRNSGPHIIVEHDLFPVINRVWNEEGRTWYVLNGVDLRSGNEQPGVSGGLIDIDLLTYKYKWRTCCCSVAFPESATFNRAFALKYRYKFCVGCSRAISEKCSRCKEYYWCGDADCEEKAWGSHKAGCVSK